MVSSSKKNLENFRPLSKNHTARAEPKNSLDPDFEGWCAIIEHKAVYKQPGLEAPDEFSGLFGSKTTKLFG